MRSSKKPGTVARRRSHLMRIYHIKHPSAGDLSGVPDARWPHDYLLVAIMEQAHLGTWHALQWAFDHTQNIEQSWTQNAGVIAMDSRLRSTSPGDVVALDDGNLYRCAMTGWQPIGTTWAAKQESARAQHRQRG